jgi:catechol 2,3-dioxygenase-like lactoylglutathione lyase family enzyme
MEQRMSVISLGVADLPAMRQLYTHTLGWQPVAANGDIVFFKLNGLLLSLCCGTQLASFASLPAPGGQSGFRGFTLAHNVSPDEQVRAL